MAEKIVQLIDNNNDNIYPVAGSLKDGSVTTSTISDEAVTSAKIDMDSLTSALYGNIVSDMAFSISRAGGQQSTHTGKKIHLGGNVYIYAGKAASSSAGSSSTGVKEYTINYEVPFTAFYGGSMNGFAAGSNSTFMRYCSMGQNGADFYLDHAATNEYAGVSFIAIGTIE